MTMIGKDGLRDTQRSAAIQDEAGLDRAPMADVEMELPGEW